MSARSRKPLPSDLRALLVEQLGDNPTPEQLRDAARLVGRSTRSLRRWIKAGRAPTGERPRFVLEDRDLEVLAETRGRYKIAWQRRREEDAVTPSLSTWSRAVKRAITKTEREYLRGGELARRNASVYLKLEVRRRNEVWEADHSQLDVWVLPPRGRPQRPWLTAFLDSYSRAVMGYALSLQPTAAEVVAGLHAAIDHDPRRGPFRGVPERLHFDNGREWLSKACTEVAIALGVVPVAVAPYSPHHKGKVERFFRTLDEEFLSQQPFYTAGPRSASAKQYWPNADPPSIGDFNDSLAAYINRYNCERSHSSLGGSTPVEVWEESQAPIHEIDPRELHKLLPSVERKVGKDGIHFGSEVFAAPELHGLWNETVEVRHMPHDRRFIHVFYGDEWICEAKPPHELAPADRRRFLEARKRERKRASGWRRKATAQARTRIEPLTGPGQKAVPFQRVAATCSVRDSSESALPARARALIDEVKGKR